jgi:septal ring factor EnvC (AmiA/AmiB activator)
VLSELMQKEGEIKEEIKKKKQQADKIKAIIDKLIADEIKKQQELLAQKNKNSKKENENTKKNKKENAELKIELTPEEALVSKNFEGNAGKLPWPVAQGVITERFGPHEHPDLPGIIVNSEGVEITSNKGAVARSVFDGEVVQIREIEGVDGKIVILRHGEYLSVYYSLENVYVQVGDKVKTKTEIGKVLTDENGKTELHLEIYKGKKLMNPEDWIASRN